MSGGVFVRLEGWASRVLTDSAKLSGVASCCSDSIGELYKCHRISVIQTTF